MLRSMTMASVMAISSANALQVSYGGYPTHGGGNRYSNHVDVTHSCSDSSGKSKSSGKGYYGSYSSANSSEYKKARKAARKQYRKARKEHKKALKKLRKQ